MMPQIDTLRALRALDDNEELLIELARIFVEDAPIILAKLKAALNEECSAQVRSSVHCLKGLVATFYASKGVEIAQRLEDSAARGDLSLFYRGELEQLENSINLIILDFANLGWVPVPR